MYIGEIKIVGEDYAPQGWLPCDGRLLNIAEYTPLFNLIGTRYGGNGTTTFALPDLRGKVPIHQGSGFTQGQSGGTETTTLAVDQLPAHRHSISGLAVPAFGANPGTSSSPEGRYPAIAPGNALYSRSERTDDDESGWMADLTVDHPDRVVAAVGGGQAHTNLQPYLCLNFVICVNGYNP